MGMTCPPPPPPEPKRERVADAGDGLYGEANATGLKKTGTVRDKRNTDLPIDISDILTLSIVKELFD